MIILAQDVVHPAFPEKIWSWHKRTERIWIAAHEQERIFERGFGKNTSFGLANSREIFDITGMTLRETGKPGKGARFGIPVPKGIFRVSGA